ncbi:hypothetical protein MTO96_005481 [Rhipicephalus appendiculatus]
MSSNSAVGGRTKSRRTGYRGRPITIDTHDAYIAALTINVLRFNFKAKNTRRRIDRAPPLEPIIWAYSLHKAETGRTTLRSLATKRKNIIRAGRGGRSRVHDVSDGDALAAPSGGWSFFFCGVVELRNCRAACRRCAKVKGNNGGTDQDTPGRRGFTRI